MGRPPLNLTRVPVRLSPEALEKIDALVGTYGRAKFVREAVEEKLAREKP
jgi:predicted DNA-binding protein